MTKYIKIKQIKSTIGKAKSIKKIVCSLGLKGLNDERVYKDNNCIRGMVNKVHNLVEYKLESKKS